jgi:glycosyltransferase involved in cell wall biosynthesis
MSRFVIDKGIDMLARVIKAWDQRHPNDGMKFVIAGMGDFVGWMNGSGFSPTELARIEHRGIVNGLDRATLLGSGKAFILPTIFVEPFGGAAIEAMLCGTPVLTPTFGAFTETVEQGVTGFRCRTVDDYVRGIENASTAIDRGFVGRRARERYSLEACGKTYDAVFKELTQRPSIE